MAMCSTKRNKTKQKDQKNNHSNNSNSKSHQFITFQQHWYIPPLFAASMASAGKPNWLISGPSCPEAKAALNMLNACELESRVSKTKQCALGFSSTTWLQCNNNMRQQFGDASTPCCSTLTKRPTWKQPLSLTEHRQHCTWARLRHASTPQALCFVIRKRLLFISCCQWAQGNKLCYTKQHNLLPTTNILSQWDFAYWEISVSISWSWPSRFNLTKRVQMDRSGIKYWVLQN